MPKLIASMSHQLRLAQEKNEELEKMNQKLKAEILLLKTHMGKHHVPLPSIERLQPSIKQVGDKKNFLKPTTASLNRSNIQEAPASPDRQTIIRQGSKILQYQDGTLVQKNPFVPDGWRDYTTPTRSSLDKRHPKIHYCGFASRNKSTEDDEALESRSVTPTEEFPRYEEPTEEKVVEEVAEKTLSERSEVDREPEEYLDTVPISSGIVFEFLQRAHRLAKVIFFDGVRKYYPRAAKRFYGPHEVQFGRKEMANTFFFYIPYDSITVEGHTVSKTRLATKIDNIADLRNIVSHFHGFEGHFSLITFDAHIRNVQQLAIAFGDEKRAFAARALRDKLAGCSKRALKSTETMCLLSEIPYGRPWEDHHQWAFVRILKRMRENRYYGYGRDKEVEVSPALKIAAQTWELLLKPITHEHTFFSTFTDDEVDDSLSVTIQSEDICADDSSSETTKVEDDFAEGTAIEGDKTEERAVEKATVEQVAPVIV